MVDVNEVGPTVRSTFFFEKALMSKENANLADRLREIVAPALDARGLVLWGLEIATEGASRVVRIFIDVPEIQGDSEDSEKKGVTIAQCAEVSRHVGLQFEVEDIVPGRYTLEVSSPGLMRRFFSLAQMVRYQGREVDLRLHECRDGRKHFKGVLADVRPETKTFTLSADPGPKGFDIDIAWDEVKKIKLIHRFHGAVGEEANTR
jgi:ribosome maturation factor RimP